MINLCLSLRVAKNPGGNGTGSYAANSLLSIRGIHADNGAKCR